MLINMNFPIYLLIGWQASRQPTRSLFKSLLDFNIDIS